MWKSVRAFDHDASNTKTYELSEDPSRGTRANRSDGINRSTPTPANPSATGQTQAQSSGSTAYPPGQRNARTFVLARAQPVPNVVSPQGQAMPAARAAASSRQEQSYRSTRQQQAGSHSESVPPYEHRPKKAAYVFAQAKPADGAGYVHQEVRNSNVPAQHYQQAQPVYPTTHRPSPAAAVFTPPWTPPPPRNEANHGQYAPANFYANSNALPFPYNANYVNSFRRTMNFARCAIVGYCVGSLIVGVIVYKIILR